MLVWLWFGWGGWGGGWGGVVRETGGMSWSIGWGCRAWGGVVHEDATTRIMVPPAQDGPRAVGRCLASVLLPPIGKKWQEKCDKRCTQGRKGRRGLGGRRLTGKRRNHDRVLGPPHPPTHLCPDVRGMDPLSRPPLLIFPLFPTQQHKPGSIPSRSSVQTSRHGAEEDQEDDDEEDAWQPTPPPCAPARTTPPSLFPLSTQERTQFQALLRLVLVHLHSLLWVGWVGG